MSSDSPLYKKTELFLFYILGVKKLHVKNLSQNQCVEFFLKKWGLVFFDRQNILDFLEVNLEFSCASKNVLPTIRKCNLLIHGLGLSEWRRMIFCENPLSWWQSKGRKPNWLSFTSQ